MSDPPHELRGPLEPCGPGERDRPGGRSDSSAGGRPADDTRRLCLWLAEQAAIDRGLVGRLCKAHGGFAAVLAQPRGALAAALRDGRDAGRGEAGALTDGRQTVSRAAGESSSIDEAVVAWCDDQYPPKLRDLFDPPPALYLRGTSVQAMLAALRLRPTVAVVGARRPSPYGLEMAWLLGAGLARAGVNVVSGMALGIDAQAHVGALEGVGAPREPVFDERMPVVLAGVLGAGVRLRVPRTNARLFTAVAERGLLLSEYGWLLPPRPWQFPARNRVIAALSDAVVIVEGRATSGALHTANFALELGRDVLAVPGEAGRPLSAGPHKLLRDGAHLCESPDDVLALLPQAGRPRPLPQHESGAEEAGLPASGATPCTAAAAAPAGAPCEGPEARVLGALRRGRHTADQLGRALDLAPGAVAATLSMLEIRGLVEVEAGGRYHLRRAGRRPAGP